MLGTARPRFDIGCAASDTAPAVTGSFPWTMAQAVATECPSFPTPIGDLLQKLPLPWERVGACPALDTGVRANRPRPTDRRTRFQFDLPDLIRYPRWGAGSVRLHHPSQSPGAIPCPSLSSRALPLSSRAKPRELNRPSHNHSHHPQPRPATPPRLAKSPSSPRTPMRGGTHGGARDERPPSTNHAVPPGDPLRRPTPLFVFPDSDRGPKKTPTPNI